MKTGKSKMEVMNWSSIRTQVSGVHFLDGLTFLICAIEFFRWTEFQLQFKVDELQSIYVVSVQTSDVTVSIYFFQFTTLTSPSVWSTKPAKPWSGDGKSFQEYIARIWASAAVWISTDWGVAMRSESEAENDVNSGNKWHFWIDMSSKIPKAIKRTRERVNRPAK